jgi:hypothetical protein
LTAPGTGPLTAGRHSAVYSGAAAAWVHPGSGAAGLVANAGAAAKVTVPAANSPAGSAASRDLVINGPPVGLAPTGAS